LDTVKASFQQSLLRLPLILTILSSQTSVFVQSFFSYVLVLIFFVLQIRKAVMALFWIGCRLQQASPVPSGASSTELVRQSLEKGNAAPTPMLAVWGLPPTEVDAVIIRVNKIVSRQPDASSRSLHVGLRNGNNDGVVVCGHPDSLHALVEALHRTQAPLNSDGTSRVDQSRIPSSKRKHEPVLAYLTVSLPFHTPLVASAQEVAIADLEKHSLLFNPASLVIPVLSTLDGKNLNDECSKMSPRAFTSVLLRLLCAAPVHWPSNTSQLLKTHKVTHIVDFGPARAIAGITSRNVDGEGVLVVSANIDDTEGARANSRWTLFDHRPECTFCLESVLCVPF
jgi:malonyl CoA-acyl carrier protein transacylase